MDHKTLIEQLGGAKALHEKLVARGLAIEPVSVRAWTLPASSRKIPAKYWTHVVEIATQEGQAVTLAELAASVTMLPSDAARAA